MLKAGVPVGTPKTIAGMGTGTLQLGNNTDLWDETWSVTDINDAGFGFQIQAVTPEALSAWAPDTYYSPMGLIIDSNGNYQIVVVPGTTDSSHPTWSTGSLGSTTVDNGVTWALYQKTGLTWVSGQTWNPGNASVPPNGSNPDGSINTPHFITATAAGTPCVFELTKGKMPRLGNMIVYIWDSTSNGAFNKAYPLGNPPAATATLTNVNSLHWYTNVLPWNGSGDNMHWYTINGDGSVGTSFDLNQNERWECLVIGQMQFPGPGTYKGLMDHDDGAMMAFDPTKVTKVAGTVQNDAWSSRSPSLGFPWMFGNNNSTNTFAKTQDPFTITVLTPAGYDGVSPIVVEFELAYTNWEHSGHLRVAFADVLGDMRDIIPVSTTLKTALTTPTWPAWSTSLAPSWPSVQDCAGNFVWVNRGPATDFAWPVSTDVTAAATTVTGSNGYKETPFRAGVSGGGEPAWSNSVGALKTDGTSLTWRNVGGYMASTSFDFSVRNGTIDIAYLPPSLSNTRAATTDEITLSLTQTLSDLQVRYLLTNEVDGVGGEIKMYDVWVEAQAG